MSAEDKSNGLPQIKCVNSKKLREILLHRDDLTKFDNLQVDTLVDSLYLEHFQSLFTHYDEKIVCNKRRSGTTEPSPIPPTNDDLWIFGYGSLVWKADFPYIDKKQGYIEGYQRRFFQHSIDHRGTHDKPGRVVTLVPVEDFSGRVYGVAYRIAKQQKDEVLAHLDYREKNGYQRCTLRFTEFGGDAGDSFDIIMYIATNDNESFAGGNENDLKPIAEQIYKSAGPSGPNREYLFNLADAMRQLFPGVDDEHLFSLEEMVLELQRRDSLLADAIRKELRSILITTGSMEEVIERFKELLENCGRSGYLDEWFRQLDGNKKLVN